MSYSTDKPYPPKVLSERVTARAAAWLVHQNAIDTEAAASARPRAIAQIARWTSSWAPSISVIESASGCETP